MKLEAKHVIVFAGLVGGVAIQLSTAHNWSEALTPGAVGGMLMSLSSGISAIFLGAPGASEDLAHANWRAEVAQQRQVDAASQAKPDVNVTIVNPVEKK